MKIRLEGLGPYAVVSALILNGGLRLFSMYKDEADPRDQRANAFFLALIAISIVASSYTSVVFTMISIHSKAAVGMGRDNAYQQYFAATQHDRTLGFRSFQLALGTFFCAFALKVPNFLPSSRTFLA